MSATSLALYADMLRNRRIEEEIARRYADQEMRCPVHLSVGQEGVSAGVCLALGRKDQIVSTHRAHAHYLSKGGDLKAMLAERAADHPSYLRYKRMEDAWRSLANEQDWLDGETSPATIALG